MTRATSLLPARGNGGDLTAAVKQTLTGAHRKKEIKCGHFLLELLLKIVR
jgi:hypothetical protein